MIANNLTQLIAIFFQSITVAFVLLKGWQWYLDSDYKKKELGAKEKIDLAKTEIELAKHNSLTAVQVAEILTHYQSVKKEIEDMKASTKIRDKDFDHALTKLEELLEELSQNFTQFLINKAK